MNTIYSDVDNIWLMASRVFLCSNSGRPIVIVENVAKMSVQAKEKKGPEYKTGIALDILFGTADPALPTNSATTATAATSEDPAKGCKRCGGTDHKRSSSKKCPYHKDRKLPPGE
jgi:hypothetical protein